MHGVVVDEAPRPASIWHRVRRLNYTALAHLHHSGAAGQQNCMSSQNPTSRVLRGTVPRLSLVRQAHEWNRLWAGEWAHWGRVWSSLWAPVPWAVRPAARDYPAHDAGHSSGVSTATQTLPRAARPFSAPRLYPLSERHSSPETYPTRHQSLTTISLIRCRVVMRPFASLTSSQDEHRGLSCSA